MQLRSGLNLHGGWAALCSVLCACSVFILVAGYCSDIDTFLYVIAVVLGTSLFLLITALIRKKLQNFRSIFWATLAYFAVTAALFVNYPQFHPTFRWWLLSNRYKAAVLAQPSSSTGALQHVEWDGWGWAANETNAYLVFDPSDSLAAAASNHSPGKYRGVPCEVPVVRRLASHWYSVQLYTDEDWDHRTQ